MPVPAKLDNTNDVIIFPVPAQQPEQATQKYFADACRKRKAEDEEEGRERGVRQRKRKGEWREENARMGGGREREKRAKEEKRKGKQIGDTERDRLCQVGS